MKVYDLVGKCLWQSISEPTTGHHTMIIKAPSSGNYLIAVSGSKGVYCSKWVVE
ncbi:MAG: T9SS type A sorting domain-containing protein [Flavobacteriaceae bacterium]|nr:T9SS type A sorting domain-containing protein [Flavobacteriaceae bacterium]